METTPLVTFSDRHTHFAISFVDIVHSTDLVANLTGKKSDFLYATFLNTLARVVQQHGAVVVKNLGDGMLYYFPDSDFGNQETFERVIGCGMAVIAARDQMNHILSGEGIEAINYRVSASYGPVSVAENREGQVADLFGSTVNTCVKMNKLANPGSMIIGEGLYGEIKHTANYEFTPHKELVLDPHLSFTTYLVGQKGGEGAQ